MTSESSSVADQSADDLGLAHSDPELRAGVANARDICRRSGRLSSAALRQSLARHSIAECAPSSFDKMSDFVQNYLQPRRAEPLVILDLGSQDFNGSYRSLFENPPWQYVGVDMAPGKNVDIVLRDPYHWREVKGESADVIVSGQTFEHTEFFWLSMREMARALESGRALLAL